MTDSAGAFFIELSSLFDPKGFNEADRKLKQSSSSFSGYFNGLNSQSESWAELFSSSAARAASSSSSSLNGFFNLTSKNFLNLEVLAEQVFGNMLSNFLSVSAQMAASSVFGSLFGGGGGSLFGSLLGSRQTGGPIDQTGPYLLHAGEFVLPANTVSAIKQNASAPAAFEAAQTQAHQGAVINITVNTPVTLNGSASAADARTLCEEISSAARRGVSWAVEQAKISYKIGKQKSGEASL